MDTRNAAFSPHFDDMDCPGGVKTLRLASIPPGRRSTFGKRSTIGCRQNMLKRGTGGVKVDVVGMT